MRKRNGSKLKAMTIILSCLFILGWFFVPIIQTKAQTPSPTVSPQPSPTPNPQQAVLMTMAENLRNMTGEMVASRQSFINSVEKPMFDWLMLIAQALALVMFGWAIAAGIWVNGGFTMADVYRIGVRAAVGFLLLFLSGDVTGDGVKGDLLNYPAEVGAYYAYGVNASGSNEGSYMATTVRNKEAEFDVAYRKFVENKLMVKVNGADLPVQYPNAKDVNLLSALYVGKFENEEDFERAKSREWWMSIMYGSLDFSRGLLAFADLFLFLMQGFAVICLRLALPLMIGMMFYKDFGQKMTIGYFWTAGVFCLLFPGVTQFLRIMFYGAGSVALGIGGDNPYYIFDAATGKITANGNPEGVILIAVVYMIFSALTMFASFFLSIYISQGKVLEGVVSTFSGWFTAATSIGMGVATGATAARMNLEAEQTQQQGILDAAMKEAEYTRIAAETGARGSNQASNVLTEGRRIGAEYNANQQFTAENEQITGQTQSAQLNTYGANLEKFASIQAEKNANVQTAYMNLKQEWEGLSQDERREKAMNFLEMAKANNDADAKDLVERLKQHPELLEVGGKKFDEFLNAVPVFGQIAKTAGFNADAFNTWARSNAPNMANNNEMYDDAVGNINNSQRQIAEGMKTPETGDAPVSTSSPPPVSAPRGSRTAPPSVPRPTATQMRSLQSLGRLTREDPNFIKNMTAMCERNGWNPNDMLNLMALETAQTFNKSIRGGGGNNYVGLIQFGEGARKDLNRRFGTPTDVVAFQNHLKGISASQQLKYVEFYMKARETNGMKLNSVSKMYAAVGAGSVARSDSTVIFRRGGYQNGDFGNTRKISRAGYKANAPWDFNGDGVIQQWEFGSAAEAKLGAGTLFSVTPGQSFKDIETASPAVAKVLANQRAVTLEREATIANNKFFYGNKDRINTGYYAGKKGLAVNRYGETVQIAEDKANYQESYRQQSEAASYEAIDIQDRQSRIAAAYRKEGAIGQARWVAGTELQANQINLETALKQAEIAYQGREVATKISFDASMKAAKERAIANMFSSIGDKAGHHLSEASEKFSRF